MSAFYNFGVPFEPFGASHFWAVAFFIAALLLIIWMTPKLSYEINLKLTRVFAGILFITVTWWTLIHIWFDRFSLAKDLPLSICNLFALIAPVLFWFPRKKVFEIIYFFVLSGTLQAIFTPDAGAAFPSYSYFKYWIVHCGLVVVVIHHLIAFQMYPSRRGMLYSFGWLNIYLLCLVPINLLLSANYFYLMSKPITPSILDFFGPWPYYIIVTEVLVMVFFALAYLPIFLVRKLYLRHTRID